MQKKFILIGSFSGALSIVLGAMAAHALKSKLNSGLITELNLQTFETAARYQMYHSIVLLIVALLLHKLNLSFASKAGYCFIIGILLFSGSLYLLSTAKLMGLNSVNWLGPITPIGGLFFIIGWLLLGISAIKSTSFKS